MRFVHVGKELAEGPHEWEGDGPQNRREGGEEAQISQELTPNHYKRCGFSRAALTLWARSVVCISTLPEGPSTDPQEAEACAPF